MTTTVSSTTSTNISVSTTASATSTASTATANRTTGALPPLIRPPYLLGHRRIPGCAYSNSVWQFGFLACARPQRVASPLAVHAFSHVLGASCGQGSTSFRSGECLGPVVLGIRLPCGGVALGALAALDMLCFCK
eukprot:2351121-Alexandrium_andersonii.AAC.1